MNLTSDPIDTPEQILRSVEHAGNPYNTSGMYVDEALAALDRYYHSQTEKVLREVIGDEGWASNNRFSINTNNVIRGEVKAEQHKRAADKGFNLKEEV